MQATTQALLTLSRAGAKMAYEVAGGRSLLQEVAMQQPPIGSEIIVNGTAVEVVQCQPLVYDCDFLIQENSTFDTIDNPDNQCASYTDIFKEPDTLDWLIAASAVVAMAMAYGIGANDSANSWGTAVGSGALPLLPAVVIGGAMDWLGAVLLGYGVSSTIRKGVAAPEDPECWGCGRCNSRMTLYMGAMFCALFAAAVFLMLCSTTAMPVSTTHAIIGGVVGATVVGTQDWGCLNWAIDGGLGGIILSWIASPLGSGVIAATWYVMIDRLVMRHEQPEVRVRYMTPVLYGVTVFFIAMLIMLKSKPLKPLPMGVKLGCAFGISILAILVDIFLLSPWLSKRVPSVTNPKDSDDFEAQSEKLDSSTGGPAAHESTIGTSGVLVSTRETGNENEKESSADEPLTGLAYWKRTCLKVVDAETADQLSAAASGGEAVHIAEDMTPGQLDANSYFKYMLVFVAALESFAHGANDTANATGAFSAVYLTYTQGLTECEDAETPVWIMAVAGACVFAGVTTLGWKVIMTIGFSLTQINFMRGYCVEFASTVTVVIFTVLNIPVSTTHCQVGAVCAAGLVSFGPANVKWSLFGRIAATWVLTLPFAALLAGGLLGMVSPALIDYGNFHTHILGPEDFPAPA